ncbi:hypothetical protein Q3G72_030303 [Acer saccharum]|nr:hypothetical protein Q3G72_030303 [Acer saccharum]
MFDSDPHVGTMRQNVSGESFGEAVALVVDSTGGETRLGEKDGGELDKPAGLASEAVDDVENADYWGGREWGPPLSEELEAA